MAKVTSEISMSLDGFIAGPNVGVGNGMGDDGDRLHDWRFDAKTDTDTAIVDEIYASTRAVVIGNRLDRDTRRHAPPIRTGEVRRPRLLHHAVAEVRDTTDTKGADMSKSTTHERMPTREQSLVGDKTDTTSWDVARERLANPEHQRTNWLAAVRPDGRPHLMPVIAFWIDGAFHFIAGEGTRKGRNLAADHHCVIGTGSWELPSLDVIVEGRAEPITDKDEVRRIAELFSSNNWPLEAKGDEVYGPNAPTAGPPPYRIFRMVPSKAFGLPGTYGMDQFKQEDLPKPTRWEFAAE